MSFGHDVKQLVEEEGNGLTETKDGWGRIELREVAQVINGFPFKSSQFNGNDGVAIVRIRDVVRATTQTFFCGEASEAPDVEDGNLLVGMDGDFNCNTWAGGAAKLNQRVCKIETDENKYSPRLMRHALPGYLSLINEHTSAVTVKHLSSKTLQQIPLPNPPRSTQNQIASKIDELFSQLDEGERALKRVQLLVERYRQSVLKAAVTGELTRDWRAQQKNSPAETGEALLQRILKARRVAWEKAELDKMTAKGKTPASDAWKKKYKPPISPDTSDLPQLPEGWAWASPVELESLAPSALSIGPFGSNLKVSDYETEGTPLIFVRNIRNKTFGSRADKFVAASKAAELTPHIARGGDVLITKMGDPPGDACVYPPGSPDAVITADCIKWTLNPILPCSEFFAEFINSIIGRIQFADITMGVAQKKVSLNRFRNIAIALPGSIEQEVIADKVRAETARIDALLASFNCEVSRSEGLKQSILRQAFAGRLIPQTPTEESEALSDSMTAERAVTEIDIPN